MKSQEEMLAALLDQGYKVTVYSGNSITVSVKSESGRDVMYLELYGPGMGKYDAVYMVYRALLVGSGT